MVEQRALTDYDTALGIDLEVDVRGDGVSPDLGVAESGSAS
jgi:hypothetical protein